MRPLLLAVLIVVATLLVPTGLDSEASAGLWSSYPRDGKFKQLAPKADMWFYVDEKRWPIAAPDKWQHFVGCYLSQKLLQKKMGKFKAFLFTETVGVLKEIDDGYREGWSPRDLIVDNLGMLAALVSNQRLKFTGTYDSERFLIRAHWVF